MFHALFRKKEDEEPTMTPLQKQRDVQIEKMTEMHANTVELVKNTDYRIPVIIGKMSITLIILLPPYFPQDKPEIQVTPPVIHPWVNEEQKVTGCASLKNFTMHSDLSRIIQDIINEFQARSPVPDVAALPIAKAPPPPFIPPEMSLMVGMPAEPYGGVFNHVSVSGAVSMDIPCCFSELRDFSVDELKRLSEDDDALAELVDRLPVVQMVENELEKLGKANEKLAKENFSQQPRIEACKKLVLDKVDELSSCRERYDENNARFQELAQRFLPSNIRELLKISTLRAEEDSEGIALKFLENKMETEEFLNKFVELRTKYHLRRVKEEKLHQQLLAMQKSNY